MGQWLKEMPNRNPPGTSSRGSWLLPQASLLQFHYQLPWMPGHWSQWDLGLDCLLDSTEDVEGESTLLLPHLLRYSLVKTGSPQTHYAAYAGLKLMTIFQP